MLNHSVSGPYADGSYCVVYPVPGCPILAAVRNCKTLEQAQDEAARMNTESVQADEQLQRERDLCGFGRMSSDLRGA